MRSCTTRAPSSAAPACVRHCRHAVSHLPDQRGRGRAQRRPAAAGGWAAAVKLEGGRPVVDVVKRLVDVGIPVMGHLGLQPQSVHQAGGYVKQATQPAAVEGLLIDALALQDAGAFSLVLESIPADVARTVTRELAVPTIGIGAGPDCDGRDPGELRHAGALRRVRAVVRAAMRSWATPSSPPRNMRGCARRPISAAHEPVATPGVGAGTATSGQ